ncbi:hypothetical protein [Mycoplasma wenyonii]|uniref:hypothetical protein n=1 Tax=Mycoplasma wenyonii TaxID=65123 RepID=UPI000DDBFD4D|nr:hypothetical protein [Mycoplasma wenyonii]
MLEGAKILSIIGGIFSGCCLIPFFQKGVENNDSIASPSSQTNLEVSSTSEIQSLGTLETRKTTLPEIKKEFEEENCEIVQPLEDVFWDLEISDRMSSYYTIVCKNTSKSSVDKRMVGEWTGIFPDVLMTGRQDLTQGKRIGIKTITTSIVEGRYKTVFEGSKLQNSSIVGEWGNDLRDAGDKKITAVTLSGELGNTNSIFLIFAENS